ncbi:MAG: hypothetical protein MUO31_00250 [Thermodesulfovibrionales bacterium]|nr:hypothetical protein [Thermodesulfovibrionales bacterium]
MQQFNLSLLSEGKREAKWVQVPEIVITLNYSIAILLIFPPPSPPALEIFLFLTKKSLLIKTNMLINNRDAVRKMHFCE